MRPASSLPVKGSGSVRNTGPETVTPIRIGLEPLFRLLAGARLETQSRRSDSFRVPRKFQSEISFP